MKTLFALCLLFTLSSTHAATLTAGPGKFDFQQGGKTVPVWYYVPPGAKEDAPLLIVMHGVKRDAERYRGEWMPHADKYGFVLVAPEFTREAWPKDSDYSQGFVLDEKTKAIRPKAEWAFTLIEPIFDAAKAKTGDRSAKYYLFGHSAGSQFVHRYVELEPQARVIRAVSANAGWWTVPDLAVDFPYGLKGVPEMNAAALKAALQRPLVVLLGTADTDTKDPNLNHSAGAEAQGPFRFARGQYFYQYAQKQAAALGVPLAWKLGLAPGVGHSDSGMSAFAVEWLFGKNAAGK